MPPVVGTNKPGSEIRKKFQNISFEHHENYSSIQNRLTSSGLEQIQRHTEKSCIDTYNTNFL